MICNNCHRDKGDEKICPYCHVGNVKPFQPHHLPAGMIVGGRYEVRGVLGEGGFGITYLACDIKLEKIVALKEYFPHGFSYRNTAAESSEVIVSGNADVFERGMRRFLSEAKTLAKFSGQPGIVEVSDYLEENHTAYLVMEYLAGLTLGDYLKEHGKIEATEAFVRLMPIINTLEMIHASGVIHRDISPDNIMIVRSGEIKLMDFGSAKEYIDSERSMSVLLKAGYAPEEQYRKHSDQGPWTDVYALCATIYRCITGKVPVDALNRLVDDTLQSPSQLGVIILPALEDVLMYGLAVRKQDRCQSMAELRRLINEAIRPVNEEPQNEVPKAEQDPYETVLVDDDDYVYRQKAEQQQKASAEHQVKQPRMKRVNVKPSDPPDHQSASSSSSFGSSPKSSSSSSASKSSGEAVRSSREDKSSSVKAEDTSVIWTESKSWVKVLSFLLLIAAVICDYFVFIKYPARWTADFNDEDFIIFIVFPIFVTVFSVFAVYYTTHKHNARKEKAFHTVFGIAVFLVITLFCFIYSWSEDARIEKEKAQSSFQTQSSEVPATSIEVKETDDKAKEFQSAANYALSKINQSDYVFSLFHGEGKTYEKSENGNYYTSIKYNGEAELKLSPSVQMDSTMVTVNETTLGDLKNAGWIITSGKKLEANSNRYQNQSLSKGATSIYLGFNATGEDVDQAKISSASVTYSWSTDKGQGYFNYQGVTFQSSMQDVIDRLGQPTRLSCNQDYISMDYDSDINASIDFNYDKEKNSATVSGMYVRYNK